MNSININTDAKKKSAWELEEPSLNNVTIPIKSIKRGNSESRGLFLGSLRIHISSDIRGNGKSMSWLCLTPFIILPGFTRTLLVHLCSSTLSKSLSQNEGGCSWPVLGNPRQGGAVCAQVQGHHCQIARPGWLTLGAGRGRRAVPLTRS